MAAEYSYTTVQTVAENENVLFTNGDRCCRKNLITHNDSSGIFRLKNAPNACKTVYRVQFNANIAITSGGTVGPISIALLQNGEILRNAVATVTPMATEDFFNVSVSTFIEIPCSCCDAISVENISATSIDVINANIIFDRVA